MCLALRASGLWLRYATLQNLIPSFPWIAPPRPPPWRNPRKGRDQILPSGNTVLTPCPSFLCPFQEIIKKDEDIGALRATLKRANEESDARAEEIASIRGEAEALRTELAAAAEGARDEDAMESINWY